MAATKSDVLFVQKTLNILGYTDAKGRKLEEDGLWGPNTQAALQKFGASEITIGVMQDLTNAVLASSATPEVAPPAPPAAMPGTSGTSPNIRTVPLRTGGKDVFTRNIGPSLVGNVPTTTDQFPGVPGVPGASRGPGMGTVVGIAAALILGAFLLTKKRGGAAPAAA